MIGALPVRDAERAFDDIGFEPAISVSKENPIMGGYAGAGLTRMAFAQPAGRQELHSHHSDAAVFAGEALEDLVRAIAGAIIDNDQFDLGAPLRQQMPDRTLNAGLLIPGGNHHGTSKGLFKGGRWTIRRYEMIEWRQPVDPSKMPQCGQRHAQE